MVELGKRKLISVIVPCYNVSDYVDRCVDSIVRQTIGVENLEIILVDDASTDDTLEHLKAWESRYPESILVVSYDENLRQGGARNVGLSYARGELIGFVDSDDYIEPGMYDELHKALSDTGVDVSQCKYIRDNGSIDLVNTSIVSHTVYRFEEKSGLHWNNLSEEDNGCGIYGGIVTRLFRRDLIFSHDIFFPEKISYEDNYWLSLIDLYTESVCRVNKVMYHYYVNTDSTTMKKNDPKHFDRLDIEVALLEEYKKRGAFDVFHDNIMLGFLQRYYLNTYHILFTRFTDIPDIYADLRSVVFHYFPNWVNECNSITPNIIAHNELLKILASREVCSVKGLLEAYIAQKG